MEYKQGGPQGRHPHQVAPMSIYRPEARPQLPAVQHGTYSTGGYYLHRITGPFKGRASGYFDPDGNLLDADQILNHQHQGRPVKRGGPMWKYIQECGRPFRPTATTP